MKKPIVKADELDAQYQSIFGDVSSIIDAASDISGIFFGQYRLTLSSSMVRLCAIAFGQEHKCP